MRIPGRALPVILLLIARVALSQSRHDINVSYIDTNCAPCQDFYGYANGGWIARAEPPDGHAAIGSLDDLNRKREATLSRILDSLRAAPLEKTRSLDRKVAEFYGSCMDTPAIEAEGIGPMVPELRRIAAIRSISTLEDEVARLHRMQIPAFFLLQALPDAKNSKRIIGDLSPAGLGLGDRGAYLSTDSQSVAGRQQYLTEIARTLQLTGAKPDRARAVAAEVLSLETRLATNTLGMEMSRDPAAVYHKLTLAELGASGSGWSWKRYFAQMGLSSVTSVNVQEPKNLQALGEVFSDVPIDVLDAYLTLRYARAATRRLGGPAIDSLLGEFGRGNLTRQSSEQRKSYCANETENHLGWIVGRIYASTEFKPAARARAEAMVLNIRSVLRDELSGLTWLSAGAKAEALRKLDSFVVEIGYPNHWPDYSGVVVRPGKFWENVLAANEFQSRMDLARIGHAQKLDDWWPGYWPQTADAYFNENLNEIVMAAGYMQPPFFDPSADDAYNFGAFGAVIGHEMTHAFDDRGRKFDAHANLRDWWTTSDKSAFDQRAARAVAQYDRYVAVDTLHLNGRFTLSENLADIGGLKLAYIALERSLAGKNRKAVNGYTPEQRFFIAYAQSRRSLAGKDFLRDQVAMNTHAPDKWRVIGAIANMPEFAAAFHCSTPGAIVLPDSEQVRLWNAAPSR